MRSPNFRVENSGAREGKRCVLNHLTYQNCIFYMNMKGCFLTFFQTFQKKNVPEFFKKLVFPRFFIENNWI